MTISQEYFDWLYHLVVVGPKSYKKLLETLHKIEFRFSIPMDQNRYEDGISLRYQFGQCEGVIEPVIASEIDIHPCSVLEMLIALALRIEESILYNVNYGDRTAEWFWTMMDNLGLYEMDDRNFDENQVLYSVERFLSRDYNPDGRYGGLFIVEDPREDLRNVEIWYQAMWWVSEMLNGGKR